MNRGTKVEPNLGDGCEVSQQALGGARNNELGPIQLPAPGSGQMGPWI
jgi:hypothetical protein